MRRYNCWTPDAVNLRSSCFGSNNQLQRSSALNILIHAISVWNTVYLTKAAEFEREKDTLNEDLLNMNSECG